MTGAAYDIVDLGGVLRAAPAAERSPTWAGPSEEAVPEVLRTRVAVQLGELVGCLRHQRAEVDQQGGAVVAVLDQQGQPGRLTGPLGAAGPTAPQRTHRQVRAVGAGHQRPPFARHSWARVRLPGRPGSVVGWTAVGAVAQVGRSFGLRRGSGMDVSGLQRQNQSRLALVPFRVDADFFPWGVSSAIGRGGCAPERLG
jgi:hypothetical protein